MTDGTFLSDNIADSSDSEFSPPRENTKKRPSHGRMKDVAKKLQLSTHTTGPSCGCKRLRCFEIITTDQRNDIIRKFNAMSSHDQQSIYLSGQLISCNPIQRHRNRKPEEEDLSYCGTTCLSQSIPISAWHHWW